MYFNILFKYLQHDRRTPPFATLFNNIYIYITIIPHFIILEDLHGSVEHWRINKKFSCFLDV